MCFYYLWLLTMWFNLNVSAVPFFLFLQTIYIIHTKNKDRIKKWDIIICLTSNSSTQEIWGYCKFSSQQNLVKVCREQLRFNINWEILSYVSWITSHVTKGQWRQMKEGIVEEQKVVTQYKQEWKFELKNRVVAEIKVHWDYIFAKQ